MKNVGIPVLVTRVFVICLAFVTASFVFGAFQGPRNANAQAISNIDPSRPFGIELGKPFPGNITYRDVSGANSSVRSTYNFVNVPQPHEFFRHGWPTIRGSLYRVTVSRRTNEVLSIKATSHPEQDGSGATTCEELHGLYNQMRDSAGLIEPALGGNPAGWHNSRRNSYRGLLIDSIDSNYRIGRTEVLFSCNADSLHIDVNFKDHAAARRHDAAG